MSPEYRPVWLLMQAVNLVLAGANLAGAVATGNMPAILGWSCACMYPVLEMLEGAK